VTPLVPLAPGRRTHVATDSRGNLYFLQETDAGQDVLFDVSQSSSISRQLELTSARILEKLKTPSGTGNIQSLAMARQDRLCFYFAGGKGRETFAALGYYDTLSPRIVLLATTDAIAKASGLGDSLELARGTIIAGAGAEMWLWLRHDDAGVLLRFDPLAPIPSNGFQLKRPFPIVRGPSGEIRIRSEHEDISAGSDGSLFYIERKDANLWKIDPAGSATLLQSLNGAPSGLTPPAFDGTGRLIMLAGNGNPLAAHDVDADMDRAFAVTEPSLLILEGTKLTALDRSAFKAPDSVNLPTLEPEQLLPFREKETWVSYDKGSGQLLQVKMKKDGP